MFGSLIHECPAQSIRRACSAASIRERSGAERFAARRSYDSTHDVAAQNRVAARWSQCCGAEASCRAARSFDSLASGGDAVRRGVTRSIPPMFAGQGLYADVRAFRSSHVRRTARAAGVRAFGPAHVPAETAYAALAYASTRCTSPPTWLLARALRSRSGERSGGHRVLPCRLPTLRHDGHTSGHKMVKRELGTLRFVLRSGGYAVVTRRLRALPL